MGWQTSSSFIVGKLSLILLFSEDCNIHCQNSEKFTVKIREKSKHSSMYMTKTEREKN